MTHSEPPVHTGRFLLLLLGLTMLAFVISTLTTTRILRRISVVEVPDLTGKSVEDARSLLRMRRLAIDIMEFRFDQQLAANQIITQDPQAGSSVKSGRIVRVVVSRGSQAIKLMDLSGLTLRDASLELGKKGLSPGRISRIYATEAPKNAILAQWPGPGEFTIQSNRVNLLISAGPRPVSWLMPALRGASLDAANRLLKYLGLDLQDIQQRIDDEEPSNTVLAQSPAPGEVVQADGTASLVISRRSSDRKLAARFVAIKFRVPAGEADARVRMSVTDGAGRHEIYNAMERRNSELDVRTTVFGGKATVGIYVNGTLVEERTL
jgi:eukaryotic-like serine/threonine-protein kinase